MARILDDDADVFRCGIERRLRGIAGAIGQRAELHRQYHRIIALIQIRPTVRPSNRFAAACSSTRELYFQLFGPVKVIDGTVGSISVIVAVMVRCAAAVAPGFCASERDTPAVPVSTDFSPGCVTRSTMFS